MIDLSETKPVYELHIWYDKTDCAYKVLMEYAGEEGDTLLEYSRGDDE